MVLLAAISDSDTDESILTEAARLADAFDDELHVVYVHSFDSVADDTATDESVKQQATSIAQTAIDTLDYPATPVGLIGEPAAEILEYAETVETRYLVIGGQKRSPVGKALFGSTTQQILLGTDLSVLTVMASDR